MASTCLPREKVLPCIMYGMLVDRKLKIDPHHWDDPLLVLPNTDVERTDDKAKKKGNLP